MTIPELLRLRLHNQLLSAHNFETPHEVVSWMAAMQSQTLDMAKWAIGVRLNDLNAEDIEQELNAGKIIRTHILRPTWHFVSAEDIHWMYELSNPRLRPVYISYCKMVGVDESLISHTNRILEKALEGGNHFTKPEISEILLNNNINADTPLLTNIISRAEMEGIICNGILKGNQQSFTLLHEWAPKKYSLTKEEALERLARKFFTSHGPATIQDFVWWSGLTTTDCRKGLESIKNDFICETINGREFWFKNDLKNYPAEDNSALLLPPFDEFVVSYKDRSEIIEKKYYPKVMTKNGLFSPTIMLNGEIIGSWKKVTKKNNVSIELSFFKKTTKKVQALFNNEIKRLEKFYGNI